MFFQLVHPRYPATAEWDFRLCLRLHFLKVSRYVMHQPLLNAHVEHALTFTHSAPHCCQDFTHFPFSALQPLIILFGCTSYWRIGHFRFRLPYGVLTTRLNKVKPSNKKIYAEVILGSKIGNQVKY